MRKLLSTSAFACLLLVSCGQREQAPKPPAFGHGQSVMAVAFTPDGNHVVTAGYDRTVRIWDAATGRELRVITANDGGVMNLAVSPDGKWIATTGNDPTVRLFDFATGQETRQVRHLTNAGKVIFSGDSRLLISTGADNTTRVWDVETGREIRRFEGGTVAAGQSRLLFYDAAFSRNGNWALLRSAKGLVILWNTETGRASGSVQLSPDISSPFLRIGLNSDGRLLAVADRLRRVAILDVATGKIRWTLDRSQDPGPWSSDPVFSMDGKWLAVSSSKEAEIWSLPGAEQHIVLTGHGHSISAVAFSPDGKRIATASFDHTARIWDLATGRQLRMLGVPAATEIEP